MNVNVPGDKEDDDPVEHALPEQYKSTFNKQTNKFETHTLTHA